MKRDAKVTTKGERLSSLIKNAWIKPTRSPIPRVNNTAIQTFSGLPSMSIAETSTHNLTREPIERSIPAVRITNISPKAAVPKYAACLNTFVKFRRVRKRSELNVPMSIKIITNP